VINITSPLLGTDTNYWDEVRRFMEGNGMAIALVVAGFVVCFLLPLYLLAALF